MSHFADTFRIKIDADTGSVRLSVRSADERVDEHIIDVRDFNAATQEVENGWVGTDVISSKRLNNNIIIAIKESDYKRIIYQVTYQHWRIVCEQFISAVRVSGIEVKSSIIRDRVGLPQLPIADIVGAVKSSLIPLIQDEFEQIKAEIRMQLSNINVTYSRSAETVNQSGIVQDDVIFIPDDLINKDLEGDIQVSSDQSSSSDVSDALEALRKLKGDKK
jgi:hypothetical protein